MSVSVIIPAYNAEAWLPISITSAWAAVLPLGGEVIVVDDASTDETAAVASAHGARVLSLARNRGVAGALNTGIAAAGHDTVAWLSADDYYHPLWASDAFRSHLSQQRVPDLTFCAYDVARHGRAAEAPVSDSGFTVRPTGAIEDDILADLVAGCFINGSTCIMKKQTVVELGGFPEQYRYGNDYALFLKFALAGATFAYFAQPVGTRQVHGAQASARPEVVVALRQEERRMFRDLGLPDGQRPRIYGRLQASAHHRRRDLLPLRLLKLGFPREAARALAIVGVGRTARAYFAS